MNRHVVSYVQRKRITDWKRIVFSGRAPVFVYGSNDDYVFKPYLESGGTLWVFSSIPEHPPELVARVDVKQVVKRTDPDSGLSTSNLHRFREFRWLAIGRTTSEFYGHNDAARTLQTLRFERASGEEWSLPYTRKRWESRHGSECFRRPQLVAKSLSRGGATSEAIPGPLADLDARAGHAIFISWKWRDSSRASVRALAHELAKKGYMPWLDQLALPAGRAHRNLRKDPAMLERLLVYGYRRAVTLVGVETPNYGTKTPGSRRNWTLREWTGSIAEKPPATRIAVAIGPTACVRPLPDANHRIVAKSPKHAAQSVCDYLQASPGPK